jgi:hypothetical protein
MKSLSIVGSSRLNGEREINDFYPTPSFCVDELLKREKFNGEIWECACGTGNISETLKSEGLQVYSSDLIDYGYGDDFFDFLQSEKKTDNIITNPPFKDALEFVLKAKQSANKKIAFFLKTVFLESADRYEMFQDKEFPLKTVYQFSKRVSLYKGGVKMKNSGMVAYAWFVWDKDYKGNPNISWIF